MRIRNNQLQVEDIGFLEKASRAADPVEHRQGLKSVVGTFGIVTDSGEELTVNWVRSSLARKIKEGAPVPQSAWMKYQLASMFGSWYPKEDAVVPIEPTEVYGPLQY